MNNWKLFVGGITAEFIESIGDGIDLVFFDTKNITPGEMLDFLIVLPFLKDEEIVVFHDSFFIYFGRKITQFKRYTSNNELMTYVRGDLILPSYGDKVFLQKYRFFKIMSWSKKLLLSIFFFTWNSMGIFP